MSKMPTKEEFKGNPALIYIYMNKWMEDAGEDFIDHNNPSGTTMLGYFVWMGYITTDQVKELLNPKNKEYFGDDIQEIFNDHLLPNREFLDKVKVYQLLAEFTAINCRFLDCFMEAFEELGAVEGLETELEVKDFDKEAWLKQEWRRNVSLASEYEYLKTLSIKEVNDYTYNM